MVETIRILRSGAPGFRKAFAALRATHAADQRRAEAAAAEIVGAVRRLAREAGFAAIRVEPDLAGIPRALVAGGLA